MHIDDHGMELKKILSYLTLLISFPVADFAESWTYTKSPESVIAPLSDTVVFTCQTNITADRVVWWHRHVSPGHTGPWTEVKSGSAKVRSSSGHRNTAKPNHSKLTVQFRNESLAGEYRCVSWFGASGLASVVAKLTKADLSAPSRHLEDRHIVVAPDSDVLLRCPRPQSEPPATILYYEVTNNNSVLVNSDKDAGDALLVHTKAGESKIYSCAAENPFAKNKRIEYRHRIKVDVQTDFPRTSPTFTEEMLSKVIVKEGESTTLGCAVIGYPPPQVTWRRRGGVPMPKQCFNESMLLHIPQVQLVDRGEYVCRVSNGGRFKEKGIHLVVHELPELIPEEYNNTVQEGGIVRLPCGKNYGTPTPSLYWMINGVEVKNDSTIKVLENEIEINPVEKRHAGLVQCFAVNSVGSVFSASLLQVMPKQHMSPDPDGKEFDPKKSGMPGHKHRPRGRRVMIPPSQPHVTRLSDESVMVRWSVDSKSGLPIKFFKVQYRDLNQTSMRGEGGARWNTSVEEIPPHIRSYALDGLTPNHFYRFRISAVYSNDDNKQGPNSSKFILLQGTDFIKMPPAPIFTRAEDISPTELQLYWELPTNISSDIPEPDGFYVYYRLSTNAGEYMKAAAEGSNIRSQKLGHLIPGTSYEIKLQSFTPTAASDFSQIIVQKTKKPPILEKIDTTTITSMGTSNGATNNNLRIYGIAGGAVGGMIILALLILTIILCKKRTGQLSNKQDANIRSGRNSGSMTEGIKGYLPSSGTKSGMTITPNPMPQESENINNLEMSYISAQNNNCSAPSSRNSVELPPVLASSCRDELRKQTPMSIPARENYV